jgi:hypothetical protein
VGAALVEAAVLMSGFPGDLARRLLAEKDERNADNVARTESYLELYALTVENGADLPWLLMAHVVSRNAGYLMTDVARAKGRSPELPWNELFLFLERANFLIFHDAWDHVLSTLAGERELPRAPAFMRDAWARHRARPSGEGERDLVLDLVHNEQHYIERRVVHNPRFAAALRMVGMAELSGRDKPIVLPMTDAEIKVGAFAEIARRIETGRRIFDEVLADRGRRRGIFEWALARPHTGDRAVAGGKPGATLREVWPVDAVRALDPRIHDRPEPDESYP